VSQLSWREAICASRVAPLEIASMSRVSGADELGKGGCRIYVKAVLRQNAAETPGWGRG